MPEVEGGGGACEIEGLFFCVNFFMVQLLLFHSGRPFALREIEACCVFRYWGGGGCTWVCGGKNCRIVLLGINLGLRIVPTQRGLRGRVLDSPMSQDIFIEQFRSIQQSR